MMPLTLILAVATDGTIGDKGRVPWTLPEDQRLFRAWTIGHAVIMGGETWRTLPPKVKPLPDRRNIVVSSTVRLGASPAPDEVCFSFAGALATARMTDPSPFVIGGAAIYTQALPFTTRILLTEVDINPAGDTRFYLDRSGFRETRRSSTTSIMSPAGPFTYRFIELERAAA